MKSIFKEIIFILLLCLAICLILCVIFYDYIPMNKVVPSNVEAYATANSIKEEIEEEIVEYPKQNVTFEITDSDLMLYKQTQSYQAGKSNPFAEYNSNNTVTTNVTDLENQSNGDINSNVSSTQGNNLEEEANTFFEDTKLK